MSERLNHCKTRFLCSSIEDHKECRYWTAPLNGKHCFFWHGGYCQDNKARKDSIAGLLNEV